MPEMAILVLFFLLLAMASGERLPMVVPPDTGVVGLADNMSASFNHFCRSGFNLHTVAIRLDT
jgi:hypothetical protein